MLSLEKKTKKKQTIQAGILVGLFFKNVNTFWVIQCHLSNCVWLDFMAYQPLII